MKYLHNEMTDKWSGLKLEAGRWTKPSQTQLDNMKYIICTVLEDEYHFV